MGIGFRNCFSEVKMANVVSLGMTNLSVGVVALLQEVYDDEEVFSGMSSDSKSLKKQKCLQGEFLQ